MPAFALTNPYWLRQLRNPTGALSILAVPVAVVALWLAVGGPAERWVSLLLIGWTLTGLVSAAVAGRRDETVEARWRALPAGAADRWGAAFMGVFPIALVAGELLVLAGLGLGPEAYRSPFLLSVGALVPAVMVAWGLAVAAWSRTPWQLAGLSGLLLLLCLWAVLPGVSGWPLEVLPTGQAKLAILGLPELSKGAGSEFVALIKLVLSGVVFAGLGVAGFARR